MNQNISQSEANNSYANKLNEVANSFSKAINDSRFYVNVNVPQNELSIGSKDNNILFILLVLVYAAIPVFWINNVNSTMITFLVIFYLVLALFIVNLSRQSRRININLESKKLTISNSNILGRYIFKKQQFQLSENSEFTVKLTRIRGRGIYQQVNLKINEEDILLFELKSYDYTKDKGLRIVEILKNNIIK